MTFTTAISSYNHLVIQIILTGHYAHILRISELKVAEPSVFFMKTPSLGKLPTKPLPSHEASLFPARCQPGILIPRRQYHNIIIIIIDHFAQVSVLLGSFVSHLS